jgi:hypothetical protein
LSKAPTAEPSAATSTATSLSDEFAVQYFYLHFVSDSSVTKCGFELTAEYAM